MWFKVLCSTWGKDVEAHISPKIMLHLLHQRQNHNLLEWGNCSYLYFLKLILLFAICSIALIQLALGYQWGDPWTMLKTFGNLEYCSLIQSSFYSCPAKACTLNQILEHWVFSIPHLLCERVSLLVSQFAFNVPRTMINSLLLSLCLVLVHYWQSFSFVLIMPTLHGWPHSWMLRTV
jgi:hypothetical protein